MKKILMIFTFIFVLSLSSCFYREPNYPVFLEKIEAINGTTNEMYSSNLVERHMHINSFIYNGIAKPNKKLNSPAPNKLTNIVHPKLNDNVKVKFSFYLEDKKSKFVYLGLQDELTNEFLKLEEENPLVSVEYEAINDKAYCFVYFDLEIVDNLKIYSFYNDIRFTTGRATTNLEGRTFLDGIILDPLNIFQRNQDILSNILPETGNCPVFGYIYSSDKYPDNLYISDDNKVTGKFTSINDGIALTELSYPVDNRSNTLSYISNKLEEDSSLTTTSSKTFIVSDYVNITIEQRNNREILLTIKMILPIG